MNTVIVLDKKVNRVNKDFLVISMNEMVCEVLNQKDIQYKKIGEYINGIDIENKAVKWLKNWSNKGVYQNKNIKELLRYDKFSVWWLMDDWLYYSYVYYDSVKDAIESLEKLKNLIEKERPDKIILHSDSLLTIRAAEIICKNKNIKLLVKKNFLKIAINRIKRKVRVLGIDFFMSSSWFLRRNWWKILRLTYRKSKREFVGEKRILFFAAEPWSRVLKKDGTYIRGNAYLHPIVEELKKNADNDIIVMDTTFAFPSYKVVLKTLKEKLFDKGIDYELFEENIDKKTKRCIKKRIKEFRNAWREIRKDKDFASSFDYEGFNIFNLVQEQFSAYFKFRIKGHIMETEIIKRIIESKKPDVVAMADETRAFGRALYHVCKSNRIPTVGIQHGVISVGLRCKHSKGEISDDIGPNICPIADRTAVYGLKDREFLMQNFYPKEKVVVTGSQRYDVLVHAKKIFNKSKTCKRLDLDENKKIVTLFTSTDSKQEDTALLKAVFKAAVQFPELQLVIKTHPHKGKDPVYGEVAKEFNSKALIIRDINTFELLNATDIVLVYSSTVGFEAMILDKPVIMINLSGQPDKVPYAESGAALGVYDEKDLAPAIKNILNDKKIKDKLKKGRSKFVLEATYKKDGMASKRIAGLIESRI